MLGKAIISDYFSQNRCADNLRPYVPLLPDILSWNNQKSHVPFSFQPDFPKTFVNGKQPLLQISAPVPTQSEGSAVNGRCTLCYYLAFLFYLAYFYQKITHQITI